MDKIITELPETTSSMPELTYPLTLPQSKTELVEVAPGIKWLRLPMPYALDHVNVYLLRLEKGWLIVDTGLDSPTVTAIWEEVFSGPLLGENVVGVCCSHHHVDHVGLAGYLTERWQAPLYMSYKEFFTLRGWPMDLKEVPWQHAEFHQRSGLPKELLQQTLIMFDFSGEISPLPPAFIRLQDNTPLPVAGGDWQVLMGEGHAPEHAMLYSAHQGILVSGDQLLPRISSNVSVSVVNPEDEPLSRWLATLERLAGLPDDTLVLPGHGLPFRGIKTRLAELYSHHENKLQTIISACTETDHSVFDLVQKLHPYPLANFDQQLAMGECLAHVRYLLSHKRLDGELDNQGTIRYRTRCI